MAFAPKVTGISPKEGPPRTKLTIRGENLGKNQFDLCSVKICDIECLIFTEWITPQKIITKSPDCCEQGPVIITTKSGGTGTSMIQFRAVEQTIGLTTPSGVWIDEGDDLFDPIDSSNVISNNTLMNDGHHTKLIQSKNQQHNILSEFFNPSLYLVENFKNSSFEELKMEYRNQLNRMNEPTNTLDSNTFLKANIVSIMDCLNALNALYLSFKKDRQEFGSIDLTVKIDDYIRQANTEAHDIFDQIIKRKDDADSKRNALNVLQRYRFLFNLPASIDKSIQRKDYDSIINDYFRAKNLFSNSQVNIFHKVYLEVEQLIKNFSQQLKQSFNQYAMNMNENNLDELKKLIKYLSALDNDNSNDNDPAWEAIILIKQSLWNKIDDYRKQLTDVTNSTNEISTTTSAKNQKKPAKILFIDQITKLFDNLFTKLFRLGYEYLNGDLYNKNSVEDLKMKRDVFEQELLDESIKLLCKEFNNCIIQSNDDEIVLWLPYCLRSTVQLYQNLLKLNFNQIQMMQNNQLLKPLQSFIFELRIHTIQCLFQYKSHEIRQLYQEELWSVQFDDLYGVRTNLPIKFESKILEILQLIRDSVIQIRTVDEIVDIFAQINVKGLIKQLIQTMIQSFIYALEKSVANPLTNSQRFIIDDNRSLIVLCNCSYTAIYVLPKLYEIFEKYGYPDMSQVIQLTQKKFKDLEQKLLLLFIERKRDEVIGSIETSMHLFDSHWYEQKEMPKDVSYYIKETIMNLIYVQSEIYKITPQLLSKTMMEILLSTIIEIERLYASYSKQQLSDAARVQMLIDINAVELVFQKLQHHQQLQQRIDSCRDYCQISIQDQTISKLIDDVTNQFSFTMRLQISCFNFYDNNPLNNHNIIS